MIKLCKKCGCRRHVSEGYKTCDTCRASYRENHAVIREAQVWSRLQTRYGVTRERYEQMLEHQDGVCAICKETCKTGQRLVVDHNHETRQVRGLLCKSCNLHLGILERHEWVTKAQEYLSSKGFNGC